MKKNIKWIITITILAFVMTIIFSLLSSKILENINIFLGIIIILFFILIGVMFDIIGVAVASSTISPFHSMASKKIKGATTAKKMLNNADKVSSFCNDVIGDVCNIISGSAGIVVATSIAQKSNIDTTISTLLVTSLIAAFTIGGKALGKGFAVNQSEQIVTRVSKIMNIFSK